MGGMGGSPPQVRGKPTHTPDPFAILRITPAGAGKTQQRGFMLSQMEDHPRRCGENFFSNRFIFALKGSPPQVRGKLYLYQLHSAHAGITPAGAGKTGS